MTHRPKLILGSIALSAAAVLLATQTQPGAASQGQAPQAPQFEVDPMWPKPLPNRWILGSAVGLAVDARDHVFVLNLMDSFTPRTEIGAATNPPTGDCCTPAPSVLEFDANGALVNSWAGSGPDWPTTPSGLAVDRQGNLWIGGGAGVDTRLFKFSRDGKLIAAMGKTVPVPAPATPAAGDTAYAGVSRGGAAGGAAGGRGGRGGRGAAPRPVLPAASGNTDAFGGVTDLSFDAAANEAFVADGYRNRRVAVVDMNSGAVKRFFGAYGAAPDDAALPAYDPAAPPSKQFSTVHCAELANDGLLYVCDRGNNRIQVFRKNGEFVKEKVLAPQTRRWGAVWDIAFSRDPRQRYLYVADGSNKKVHVVDRESLEHLTSFGDGGRYPGQFLAVRSIATDSKGNVYTVEAFEGKRVQKFSYRGIGRVTKKDQGVLWPKR
jgi:sugar lactone lactonase YvrE